MVVRLKKPLDCDVSCLIDLSHGSLTILLEHDHGDDVQITLAEAFFWSVPLALSPEGQVKALEQKRDAMIKGLQDLDLALIAQQARFNDDGDAQEFAADPDDERAYLQGMLKPDKLGPPIKRRRNSKRSKT